MTAAIETHELTKTFDGTVAVDRLDLCVAPAQVFGFLGPNGAGKTTTIRALLDLCHPSSGSARVFGLDSRRDSVATDDGTRPAMRVNRARRLQVTIA